LISISYNRGKTYQEIGHVIKPAFDFKEKGFTASKWGMASSVVASAVNALHLKKGNAASTNRGTIVSVLPDFEGAVCSSCIRTSIAAGTSIFGSDLAPYVGNPVYYLTKNKQIVPLFSRQSIELEDEIMIQVLKPQQSPTQIVFENKFNGDVLIYYPNKRPEVIAKVIKPVMGVGRFAGGQFTGMSRIRANHPGVIDISLSSLDSLGGFQIIPAKHGMSEEMYKAITFSQWLVVGGLQGEDLTGKAPLFRGFLKPSWLNTNRGSNYVVQGKKNERWQTLPVSRLNLKKPLQKKDHFFLKDFTAFRILFPQEAD
jgi:hypothetical protein